MKDFTGNTYGRLTVIEEDFETEEIKNKKTNKKRRYWKCKCSCGNIKTICQDSFNKVKSCGCLIDELRKAGMRKSMNLIGNTYGYLTVLERDFDKEYEMYKKNNKHIHYWKCECVCGNIKTIRQDTLLNGLEHNCGCIDRENSKKRLLSFCKTHNLSNSKLYKVYYAMISRCYNKNNKRYDSYGGRGIDMCDEWLDKTNGFINFYKWSIENGYEEGLSIDRINNDYGYYPENCRWTDRKTQQNNTRFNKIIEFNGEKHTLSEWSEILNISYTVLSTRLNRNWSIDRAFTTK